VRQLKEEKVEKEKKEEEGERVGERNTANNKATAKPGWSRQKGLTAELTKGTGVDKGRADAAAPRVAAVGALQRDGWGSESSLERERQGRLIG
jgi:hypothetical protein